jgi:prepilin-type processing-associated H-X9-DG protein
MTMYRVPVLLFALVLAAPTAAGEKKFDPEARAKAIAPFRDEQAFVIVHVDLTRVDADKLRDKLVELTKEKAEEVNKEMSAVRRDLGAFKDAGGKDVYFVLSLADLHNPGLLVVPLYEDTSVDALLRLRKQMGMGGAAERVGNALVAGDERTVARVRNLKAEPYPELAKAFEAAGDTVAQVLLLPSPSSRQVVEQMLPQLPREVGNGPSTVLTRGIQWAAAGADLTPNASLKVTVQSRDAKAAEKLHEWVVRLFERLGEQKEIQKAFPNFQKITAALTPKVEGDRLTLNLDEQALVAAMLPAIQKVRSSANRAQSSNNLKQMALAMHNYLDVYKTFPAHASYKDGKPLLSWRVHILPFIEQDHLYRQFHLDEPWDSEHNRKLIAQMPKVYASPDSRVSSEHKTVYLVPVGKDTIFPPSKEGMKISHITDGTSNTILIVEAADKSAVIWTKPDDLEVKQKNPLAGLNGEDRKGFNAAFADGSVRYLSLSINPQTLWALFTRNGGEVVEQP